MENPERWKQYDKDYWVSDLGRVKRVYKNGNVKYLSQVKRDSKDKSLRVKLHCKYVSIRRLVWTIFNGEIPEGYAIINKNGCHTMNDLYNLVMVPMHDGVVQNNKSKMKQVINLDSGVVYPSVRYAGQKLHISHQSIAYYCRGKCKNPIYNVEYFDEDKDYRMNLKFIRA